MVQPGQQTPRRRHGVHLANGAATASVDCSRGYVKVLLKDSTVLWLALLISQRFKFKPSGIRLLVAFPNARGIHGGQVRWLHRHR